MNSKNKKINKGAALLLTVFMLLFFVLIARFGYIQITQSADGKGLVALAKERWTSQEKLKAQRGTIFDVNGGVLAEDVPSFTVKAILSKKMDSHVKNPEKTAAALAPILNMKKSQLRDLLTRDAFQVELGPGGRRIGYEKMKKIKKLDLPGIEFEVGSKRYYPNQKFASYVVGVEAPNSKTGKVEGVLGVEKSMNKKLTGQPGSMQYMSSQNGVKLPGTSDKKMNPPHDGDNVYLTLDSHIQMFLEHAIDKVNKNYHPKRIMAIVMDPKTGAVLAMANRPSFNPNKRDISDWTNNIVANPFEPGSVMKIFTLAAAVDAGVYNGHAKYQSGSFHVPGATIHDWNRVGWGRITFNEAIQRSSNVGFAILAKDYIGFDRFYKYLQKFDFQKKTGIDLPNESNSHFVYNYPAGKATTAFGQGTAITAIQLVKGATAIANDGKMMAPHIIDKIVDPNTGKVVFKNKPKVAGTPISAKSAKKVRDLLRMVITGKYGTGKAYAIPNYKVTGKTGTAQIINPKTGEYYDDKYIHSFLGMAPMDNPQLIVYVAVDRPDVNSMSAGDAPVENIFKPVMEHSLEYLNINPDKKSGNQKQDLSITLPDTQGKSVESVRQELEGKGLDVTVLGSGKTVTGQLPVAGKKVLSGSRVLLKTTGNVKMPDLSGWSLGNVMKLVSLLNLHRDVKGSGYVVSQSIEPGKPVNEGATLTVKLDVPHPPTSKTKKDKS